MYTSSDAALKSLLLDAMEDIYLRTLKDSTTGFATANTLQLLKHLYDTYGRITPAALIANDLRFK